MSRPRGAPAQAISDPVWGTNSNPNEERVARVLGALKCIYGLAKVPNAKFWACNNYNLRGDAYAATVVPPPRVGYIRAALNGDTTWYVASAINFFGKPLPGMGCTRWAVHDHSP